MSTVKAVINSNKKNIKSEYFIHGNTLLLVNSQKVTNIDFNSLKKKIEKNIPNRLFRDLDWIYVGDFPELKSREVGSAYLRGAIYISDENQTQDSLFSSIIHELAHSIESSFKEYLYGDNEIAEEFVIKRKKLKEIFKANNLFFEDPSVYIRTEYNPQFDEFLYKTVGYDRLNILCVGLFSSAYGTTSLREYFANGFEHFYLHDRNYLAKISPKLFLKISKLTKKAE
jgi:hypothetical protein